MNITDKINKYLNEKKIIVTDNDTEFEIEIIDGTHLKMKMTGTNKWASALHIKQVSDEMIKQLKSKGLIKGNFFKSDK